MAPAKSADPDSWWEWFSISKPSKSNNIVLSTTAQFLTAVSAIPLEVVWLVQRDTFYKQTVPAFPTVLTSPTAHLVCSEVLHAPNAFKEEAGTLQGEFVKFSVERPTAESIGPPARPASLDSHWAPANVSRLAKPRTARLVWEMT